MRKSVSLFMLIFLCISLSACSKSKDTVESFDFGQEGTTSEKDTEYSIEDPNFELPTKSSKDIELEVKNDIDKVQESLEAQELIENSKYIVTDDNLNETVDIREIEENKISSIIDDIKMSKYATLEDVNNYVDEQFSNYSDTVRVSIKNSLKETWDYWEVEHEKMSHEKPWTEEELLENPLRRDYTREEYNQIEQSMNENGYKIGGQGLKDIMSGD